MEVATMQTRREILSGFSAIPLAAVMPQADSLAQAREGRDKELGSSLIQVGSLKSSFPAIM